MTNREGPAGVATQLPSIAILALVILPLAGCSSAPVQADPAIDAGAAPAQTVQDIDANVAPARTVRDTDADVVIAQPGDRIDVNVVAISTDQDAEDGAVLLVGTAPDRRAAGSAKQARADVGAGAVRHALEVVGTPYVWGGNTPRGFDCSGLVQYSYSLVGVELPRVTIMQRSATQAVSRKQLRPGDLVFFHIDGKRNSHIGIYIGDGKFVHAPRTGKFVSTASLSNPYWQRNFAGARRPLALADNRRVDRASVDRVPVDRVSVLDRLRTEQ
jgi:murein DD-endopeptidase